MNWTDEQTTLLRQRWDAGKTASEIAREIGITRNAVIGKAHRLNLAGRDWREARRKGGQMAHTRKARKRAKVLPVALSTNPVTIDQLSPDKCRFPLWGPNARGGLYCGDPAVEGLPYCDMHCRKCYHAA